MEICWLSWFTLSISYVFLHKSRSWHYLKWSGWETLWPNRFKTSKVLRLLTRRPHLNNISQAPSLDRSRPGAAHRSINQCAGDETAGIQADATELIKIQKKAVKKGQVLLTESNNDVPTLSLEVTQTSASQHPCSPPPPRHWSSWALCSQERGRMAWNLPLQGQGDA